MSKSVPKIFDQSWFSDPELRLNPKNRDVQKTFDHPQGNDKARVVKCPMCECSHIAVTSATRVFCTRCRTTKDYEDAMFAEEYCICR